MCWLWRVLAGGENNIFINTKIENKLNGLAFVPGIKWQNLKDFLRKTECLSFVASVDGWGISLQQRKVQNGQSIEE